MPKISTWVALCVVMVLAMTATGILLYRLTEEEEQRWEFYAFQADVTIPLGHRCMGVLPRKAEQIASPLEARGFVLRGRGSPVVFVGLDWCEIRNDAYTLWREALAQAAQTQPDRVLLWCVHQHDAPLTDQTAAALLEDAGLGGELFDVAFQEAAINRVTTALREAEGQRRPLTHIGTGAARVERIASSRRVRLENGAITFERGSRSGADPFMAEAPEGLIDPWLRCLTFWSGEEPLAALHVYATHPMSRYGEGEVSSDFPGKARTRLQAETPGVMQIYASGCSGDLTAGKYNDGSPESREMLADRLYQGMRRAWETGKRVPLTELEVRTSPLLLPYRQDQEYSAPALEDTLRDSEKPERDRILAAMGLSTLLGRRSRAQDLALTAVDLGGAQVLLFPGETFVGYQSMAQKLREGGEVFCIGYGDCWPGYIPMERDYAEGFRDDWSWVGPGSELAMRRALWAVLPDSAARWTGTAEGRWAEGYAVDVYAASQEHPRYSEGSVARFPDGRLLHAVTEFSEAAEDDAPARLVLRESMDGGRTWGELRVLVPNEGGRNVMSVSLLALQSPEQSGLGLFYLIKNGPSDLRVRMRLSEDGGASFGEAIDLCRRPGYHVMNNDRVLQLSGGRVLCPVAWTSDVETENRFEAFCLYSDDGGRGWEEGSGSVVLPGRGAMEPGLIERRDGSVVMYVRTQLGEIYGSLSTDGGETWDEPRAWGVPSPESPATVRRIPQTGDWLMLWNPLVREGEDHGGPRRPLAAAVSPDEGRTWKPWRVLEDEEGKSYAYTSLTFDRGSALLTYGIGDESTGRISSRFRAVPVTWFYGEHAED
ncbi:MAG TPA: sialidase family protein [Verrucomicrobiales bacterium]|nr:sialidase family protein [Verrucomicrobiales bacterium]